MHPFAQAIIPARYQARRFPGKPLADIAGLPMVVRVAEQAKRAKTISKVVVATDDARIADAVRKADFEAVMTREDCASGTDRVYDALLKIEPKPQVTINVQGDEPMIDPADIDALATGYLAVLQDGFSGIGTLARPLEDEAQRSDPNVVKVVVAKNRALYFSRAALLGALHHVGLYAYSPESLSRFVALSPSRLEAAERLEQLRALENDIPIFVTMCVSERPTISVDTEEDLLKVVRALKSRDVQ